MAGAWAASGHLSLWIVEGLAGPLRKVELVAQPAGVVFGRLVPAVGRRGALLCVHLWAAAGTGDSKRAAWHVA